PWVPLIPGLPVVFASLAFNFIGDGLRDALDPRLKL
ncbi:MAG: ABC transporter permease, partial [candidate division WOR-3 bacterium]|nr:ABC transporter permease [candidate division WOR-3 bacterium]